MAAYQPPLHAVQLIRPAVAPTATAAAKFPAVQVVQVELDDVAATVPGGQRVHEGEPVVGA